MALLLLDKRFGPLSPVVNQRVAELNPEQLRQLTIDLMKANSLKELQFED